MVDTRTSRTLRKKCLYSELFWSVFSGIWTECGYIRSISPYSVRMRENTNQNNSQYEDFTVPYLSRALFALFLFVRSSVSSQRRISELAHQVHKKRKVTELCFWKKKTPVKISQKVHKMPQKWGFRALEKIQFIHIPAGNYMFKVNRNTRTNVWNKLMKTLKRRHGMYFNLKLLMVF